MSTDDLLSAGSPGTPIQTLVKLQILANDLDRTWALPESLPQPGENTIRLRESLTHQIAAVQAGMQPGDIHLAEKCVHAITHHNLIQRTANLLAAYEYFRKVKRHCDTIPEIESLIKSARRWVAFSLAAASLAGFLVFSRISGFETSLGYLGYWIILTGLAAWISATWITGLRPDGYAQAACDYQAAHLAAQAGNEYFWKQVRDEFGGIPSPERVRQAQEETISVLVSVFGSE